MLSPGVDVPFDLCFSSRGMRNNEGSRPAISGGGWQTGDRISRSTAGRVVPSVCCQSGSCCADLACFYRASCGWIVITRPHRAVVQAARSGQPAHHGVKRARPPPPRRARMGAVCPAGEIQHLCTISIHYRVKINGSGFGGMRTKCANFTVALAGYVSRLPIKLMISYKKIVIMLVRCNTMQTLF